MKNTGRMTPELAAQLAKRDRNRMIMMAIAVIFLGVSYFVAQLKKNEYEDDEREGAALLSEEPLDIRIAVPEFDDTQVLEQIRDASEQDRVLVDKAPLASVMKYVGMLDTAHFVELGGADLTPEVAAEISADPGAQRLRPLRARGVVTALGKRRREGASFDEHHGTIALESGGSAHFVVHAVPNTTEVGHFVMLDGLFFKIYSAEAHSSGFIEAPLLLGRRLTESFQALSDGVAREAPALSDVVDDTTGAELGIPLDARWQLMAKARLTQSEPTDDLLELNNETMTRIFQDGSAFRGQRFRLPVSRNMGIRVRKLDENPLRLGRMTTGFIANTTWKGSAPLLQFVAPFADLGLQDFETSARYVVGSGYFLKNTLYEKRDGQPALAPFFVMDTITVFQPGQDKLTVLIMWSVFAGAAILVGAIGFLLLRDKRQARALQEELIRRRRERRSRSAQPSQS